MATTTSGGDGGGRGSKDAPIDPPQAPSPYTPDRGPDDDNTSDSEATKAAKLERRDSTATRKQAKKRKKLTKQYKNVERNSKGTQCPEGDNSSSD